MRWIMTNAQNITLEGQAKCEVCKKPWKILLIGNFYIQKTRLVARSKGICMVWGCKHDQPEELRFVAPDDWSLALINEVRRKKQWPLYEPGEKISLDNVEQKL